jgi:hypothetical protein
LVLGLVSSGEVLGGILVDATEPAWVTCDILDDWDRFLDNCDIEYYIIRTIEMVVKK